MTSTTPRIAPSSGHRLSALTRRQLLLFAALCLVISLGFWTAVAISGGDVRESPTLWLFALGASGPSLAALGAYLVLRRRDGERATTAAPWIWLPLAVVLGALPATLSALLLDGVDFAANAPAVVAASGGALIFTVMYLIAGPLAEEFGWRGYLQPRIRQRYGILATALVVGIAWALWHVPLFFLTGTGQEAMGFGSLRSILFFVAFIPLSVTYLFVSERLRGRVWSAIVLHFAGNASLSLFAPDDPANADLAAIIHTAVVFLVAAGCLLAWRMLDARRQVPRTDDELQAA
jgi:membrane protease YdiL (CAAX protease family)